MNNSCRLAVFIMATRAVSSCLGNENVLCNAGQCDSAKLSIESLVATKGTTDEGSLLQVNTKENAAGKHQDMKAQQSQNYMEKNTRTNHSGDSPCMEDGKEYSKTSSGKCCTSECKDDFRPNFAKTSYNYCWTHKKYEHRSWDYCAKDGETSNRHKCIDNCDYRGKDHQWCKTDVKDSDWDYCVKGVTIDYYPEPPYPDDWPCVSADGKKYHKTSSGTCCQSECNAENANYDYCWTTAAGSSGAWDYCAKFGETSGKYKCDCELSPCNCDYHGYSYQWCKVYSPTTTWDYCVKGDTADGTPKPVKECKGLFCDDDS